MTAIRVTGNTFDHRDRLKQLGGRWDASGKCWVFDWLGPKDLAELKNLPGCLVTGADGKPKRTEDTTPAEAETAEAWLDRIEREIKSEEFIADRTSVIYGDDPTYFNHFKDKNPISYFGFSSLSEMMKFIDAIPEHKRTGRRDQGYSNDNGAKWYGSSSMGEAMRIAKDGWKEGVEKASSILEFLNLENATQRRRAYSVAGGNVSVGRLLAGNPKHMVHRPKLPGKRTITLFVENTASARIEAEMLAIRASIVAAFADILESRGYSCQIVAVTMQGRSFFGSDPGAQTAVTVKHAGEKLNLDDIVFTLGHPSFLRRFNFACVSQADELRSIWDTQGTPQKAFNKTERNEFYIRHLTSNINGSNFIEIAKKMLPMLKPRGLPLELELENDNQQN
ncbi:hypothetical protein P106B_22 [Rhizobium phage vB_RglS_P106B]|uniref:DUF7192 domain-containing protein n=1 Tax=Rhizobium phage vB_RglS_P106B TaxID=1458697 RepID=W6E8E8_9CAUD|nr:hypothetical protein P106B_22 [Rhizobium phage vB_RglS_P106B]AHJ10705.1 hypothetical protein P106B_22 [Rhizobium phage vB_RglS_P106B]